jgi:hypothetical protein
MGMSSWILGLEDKFADEVSKHIGGCEDITDLQDKLVVNKSFDLLAHMSDEEKTEVMSDHWNEYWSSKGETK